MPNESGEKMEITTLPSHVCEIDITFPTDLQAEQALKILQVDKEPTDRVSKTFQLVRENATIDSESGGTDSICKLKVRFESKELKMVRVGVSSFYDYLTVVLKTLQEFDATI
mmetsp:Transcript_12420/g.31289  ORF Transcript_12420/g.31289 Transcript_12420/m.31289 type:complete len:112 (-) Transcript_12420:759-1094(-)